MYAYVATIGVLSRLTLSHKGKCYAQRKGFDGCPVVKVSYFHHYCRTKAAVNVRR